MRITQATLAHRRARAGEPCALFCPSRSHRPSLQSNMAYNQQQQQGYRSQQQQQQHHQQYIPPHARPRVASSSSQGMDLDQPPRSPGAAASQGEYVYFDRHPELYDSLKGKANECKLRLELWYKDGVEGAVQRRERSVVSSIVFAVGDAR